MIEIIEQFFTYCNYDSFFLEEDTGDLLDGALFAIDKYKSSAYLIMKGTPEANDVENWCDQIYDSIVEYEFWRSTYQKNLVLVFLNEVGFDENIGSNTRNLMIEENKYFFKKHVLQYLQAEVKLMEEKLIERKGWVGLIQNELFDDESFDEFRDNPNIPSSYSLLMKIMIKIPIYEIQPNKYEMQNVKSIISEELREEGLSEVRDFILELDIEESENKQIMTIEKYFINNEEN